jgi:hypothetical protein
VTEDHWNTSVEKDILEEVADDLSLNMHALAHTVPVSHSKVWRV